MPTELTRAIERTVTLLQNGDRDDARALFTDLWTRAEVEGDAFDRTVLCHYMADTQDEVMSELTWDLRALECAEGLSDELLSAHDPALSVAVFLPSLHLNLAADYERLGDEESARCHIKIASALVQALPNTPSADLTRAAISRLASTLDEFGDFDGPTTPN